MSDLLFVPFRERLQREALKMAVDIGSRFEQSKAAGLAMLPKQTAENRSVMMNTMLDGLIGAFVMIASEQSGELSAAFEEAIVANIHYKFGELRKINLGGDRDMGQMPVSDVAPKQQGDEDGREATGAVEPQAAVLRGDSVDGGV